MKKPPRLVYEVRFEDGWWECFAPDGETILTGRFGKSDTVDEIRRRLSDAWAFLRLRSELVIKNKKGEIQDKRTYGEDPRRTRG